MDEIGGIWRTVGGRRIFIKNGKDLATAMKESGKFSNNKIEKIHQTAILMDSKGNEYKIDEEQLRKFVTDKNLDISNWKKCDSNLQEEYSKQIGYSSPMQEISKKEYDKYKSIELSRVVTGKNKSESDNIVINSKAGEIQYSAERRSYYGKGLYYGTKESENKLVKDYGNENSSIINCKISKKANILEFEDMIDYIQKANTISGGFKNSQLRVFFSIPAKNRNIMFMNAGIDIIKIKRDNYYVILNRGVLITYDE